MSAQFKDQRLAIADALLSEWASNLHYPGFNVWPSDNVLQKLRRDRRNTASGAQPSKFEVIDGIPCRPDGGYADMVDRMAAALERANRVRQVSAVVAVMTQDQLVLVKVTYFRYSLREDVLTAEQAAEKIGISRATFFRRREEVLSKVAHELCITDVREFPNYLRPRAKQAA